MTVRAAEVGAVLEGGRGPFVATGTPIRAPDGWIEEERTVAGTATSYRAKGDPADDGRLDLIEEHAADYRTRIVVVRPRDPADFNGTVVVEWFNVTGGLDAAPDRALLADELHRGYAWVGVSAQHIGVEGGVTLVVAQAGSSLQGRGLKALDPERYASLQHPGDAFAYDIFTQVARAIRVGDVLGDLVPERVLAVGSSQSAFALTTYVNGVHALDPQFDGYLVHSRAGGAAPLGAPGAAIESISAIIGPATIIRADVDVPVLILQTETDLTVLGYLRARQDDTDRIRLWEVAGAAHADRYVAGAFADSLEETCGGPVNDGPHHFVAKAALRALDRWVRTEEAPPPADRLEVDEANALRRDDDGIVLGGIRTPLVDAPVAALSGEARPGTPIVCMLFGATAPLPAERLADRYGSVDGYLAAYESSVDDAIGRGFVLAEDRAALLAAARPDLVQGTGAA